MKTTELKHKEHILAKKAEGIYEHRQRLKMLENQKEELLAAKPEAEKEQLSYLESIEFGRKISRYKNDLKKIDLKVQKLTRELSGLKKQAKKLLPASGVKIKVATPPQDNSEVQAYCIQYLNSETNNEADGQFEIEPLSE